MSKKQANPSPDAVAVAEAPTPGAASAVLRSRVPESIARQSAPSARERSAHVTGIGPHRPVNPAAVSRVPVRSSLMSRRRVIGDGYQALTGPAVAAPAARASASSRSSPPRLFSGAISPTMNR